MHRADPTPLVLATLPGPDGPFHLAVSAHGVAAAASFGSAESFRMTLRRRFGDIRASEQARAR
ncbi:MAG: hypothetical protein WEC14_03395, partial [Chloroflexota bacterium]